MTGVVGLETEYGLRVQVQGPSGWRRLGPDEAAARLFEPVVAAQSASNAFLRNGGRLYLDVGSHPEYATPECLTIADLVAHDRAGDLVVARLAERLVQNLAAEGLQARVNLFKNNVDSHGNSWGSHENHQVTRDFVDRMGGMAGLARQLSGFLVTRQLVCGTGHWQRDRHGRGTFRLSQRADHMWGALSAQTTRSRPMINTRDEPPADADLHRRLHVIVGDSSTFEATTALRVGTTRLVLAALSDGFEAGRWAPSDASAAIRTTSAGLDGRSSFEVDGATTCALEVQEAWWQATAPHAAGELAAVHRLWGRALSAMADRRPEDVAHLVEWVAKRQLLSAEQDRHRFAPDDARLAQVDLAWHEVTGRGLARLLEERGLAERWNPPGTAEQAVDRPPSTRAVLRSRLLTAAQANHREHLADWARFDCRDLADGAIRLDDPCRDSDPRVDELCRRMASEPRRVSSSAFNPDGTVHLLG